MSIVMRAAFAAALVCAPAQAFAQSGYPTRPITVFPVLAAGTGLDIIVRMYGEQLAASLKQPVIVENKPGSAGLVAVAALKAAAPDGYTLMTGTSALMAIRPTLLKKPPYEVEKDFAPISIYLKSPFILVVNPALPVKSVPELIAYIKERPGKLSYSSSGVGGAPHLAAEYMKQRYGLDITHVPYKNSPQSIADVAAGHVAMAFAEAGASVPLIQAGKLRALAVSATTRLPILPDVPPFAEAAKAPDFEAVSWHILVAPGATPAPIVERLHGEMKRIMAEPGIRQKVAGMGLIPQDTPSLPGLRDYMRAEHEKWGSLVKKLGLAGSQ
jgi:tripartite-type tricarboxylate transporter receptor subunit TctC